MSYEQFEIIEGPFRGTATARASLPDENGFIEVQIADVISRVPVGYIAPSAEVMNRALYDANEFIAHLNRLEEIPPSKNLQLIYQNQVPTIEKFFQLEEFMALPVYPPERAWAYAWLVTSPAAIEFAVELLDKTGYNVQAHWFKRLAEVRDDYPHYLAAMRSIF